MIRSITNKQGKKGAARQNFGLDEADFDNLVERLREGDESLFERVFLVHFDDCTAYLRKNYQASEADAYDASMDALLDFHDGIKAGRIRYGNLRFLLTRMASQLYFRQMKRKPSSLEANEQDIEGLLTSLNTPAFTAEVRTAFDRAWANLDNKSQELLLAFYVHKVRFSELAQEWNKSEAALRKQKQRCLEKLQDIFRQQYHAL